MYVDMGQGCPGSQTQTPITLCIHQKVVIPACCVQITMWQLQLFSLLCPLSSLKYKDLAGCWPADQLKAVSLALLSHQNSSQDCCLVTECRLLSSARCDSSFARALCCGRHIDLCSPGDEKCIAHGPGHHMHMGSAHPHDGTNLKAKLVCGWESWKDFSLLVLEQCLWLWRYSHRSRTRKTGPLHSNIYIHIQLAATALRCDSSGVQGTEVKA